MSETVEPKVERGNFKAINRKLEGEFQYSESQVRSSSFKFVFWGLGGVIAILFVFVSGAPEKKTVEAESSVSIPFVAPSSDGIPIVETEQYSRAKEANEVKTDLSKIKTEGKMIEKFLGPQLISRNNGLKIPLGTLIRATLNSGASNGLVKASLKEAIVFQGETMAAVGDVIIGNGSSSEDRLFIQFSNIVARDGRSHSIQAEAVDSSDKTPGLKGSKISAQALKLAMGIGLNFLSGVSAGLQETQGEQGVLVQKPSVKNALLRGTAQASLDQSREVMSDLRNSKPVIAVQSGTEIYVLFSSTGDTE